jgi:Histone H1-like protein Hc1
VLKEKNMTTENNSNPAETKKQISSMMSEWLLEDEKFTNGNNAAGTRARKALGELAKLVKLRRNEITAEKNSRAEAKKVA